MKRIPKYKWVSWSCHGCAAENTGEVEYCWKCGKDRAKIESLQVGKTYRVNPTGSHTIDNGRGQPIQVDVEPFDRPARRKAPDHDSMGPMK